MSRRKSRNLSPEERHLWRKFTESVTPSPPTRIPSKWMEDPTVDASVEPSGPGKATPSTSGEPNAGLTKLNLKEAFLSPYRPPTSQPQIQSHLSGIDHKSRKRLKRGQDRLDATIDLHGLTQEAAYRRLIQFLHQAQRDGARYVLVITGKGRSENTDTGARGVLRRAVPQWLASRELKSMVVNYDAASIAHGGTGALYVRLRKRERMGRGQP